MRPRITHSYEYNAVCDSCKFVYKASELRLRWDGFMVCKDDWEPRHPSDFYRARNDVHKLPFTRSDEDSEPTWSYGTSILLSTTRTAAAGEAATFPTCFYRLDPLLGKTTGGGTIIQWVDSATQLLPLRTPRSTISSASFIFSLPDIPTTGGSLTYSTDYKLMGTALITAGSPIVSIPVFSATPGNLYATFSYGT